jgi:ribosome biogenesis protein YTM1
MTESVASSSRQGQVQVHFITNSPDIELPEGKRQLLVPTSE